MESHCRACTCAPFAVLEVECTLALSSLLACFNMKQEGSVITILSLKMYSFPCDDQWSNVMEPERINLPRNMPKPLEYSDLTRQN